MATDLITTREAGEILGVNASRVRQLILSGELKAEKVGRDSLLHRSHVESLKRAREAKKAA